VSEQLTSLFRI